MPITPNHLLDDIEIKQTRTAYIINTKLKETFNNLLNTYNDLYKLMWNNDDGLTPQQVCDALGNKVAEFMLLANLCVYIINAAKPNSLDPIPPLQIVRNEDGTVTLTPYPESSSSSSEEPESSSSSSEEIVP